MEASETRGQTHTSSTDTTGTPAAPITSLSFELLSQIFLECLPIEGFPTASITVAPLLLGRICSHWRSVALSTPQLWAGLDLGNIYPNTYGGAKDAVRITHEWTIRAESCLLSYRLLFTPKVLDVVLPYCNRWRYIEGNFESDAWDTFYSTVSRGVAPHLRHLDVGLVLSPSSSVMYVMPMDVKLPVPGAALLESLRVKTGCNIHFDRMEAPSLRTLIFNGTNSSLDDCWSCLRYCPNLEHFSANCQVKVPFTITPEKDYVHEAKMLKDFRITLHFADTGQFLDRLHMPALEKLEFNFYNPPEHSVGVPGLPPFLKRSGARLVDLKIDVPLTRDQVLECLHHTPALTSLEMHSLQRLDDRIVQALTLRPGIVHDNICVELQTLTLAEGSDLSIQTMETMILSRWGGSTGRTSSTGALDEAWARKLRHVIIIRLDFGKDILLSERPKMMRCVEEGLEIEEQPPERYDSDSSEDF